jgi:hypothetical protein
MRFLSREGGGWPMGLGGGGTGERGMRKGKWGMRKGKWGAKGGEGDDSKVGGKRGERGSWKVRADKAGRDEELVVVVVVYQGRSCVTKQTEK